MENSRPSSTVATRMSSVPAWKTGVAGLQRRRSLGLRVSGQHDAVRLGPMLEQDILARRAAL
jgi:hypothetical protein